MIFQSCFLDDTTLEYIDLDILYVRSTILLPKREKILNFTAYNVQKIITFLENKKISAKTDIKYVKIWI